MRVQVLAACLKSPGGRNLTDDNLIDVFHACYRIGHHENDPADRGSGKIPPLPGLGPSVLNSAWLHPHSSRGWQPCHIYLSSIKAWIILLSTFALSVLAFVSSTQRDAISLHKTPTSM